MASRTAAPGDQTLKLLDGVRRLASPPPPVCDPETAPQALKLYDPSVAYPFHPGTPIYADWDTEKAVTYGYNACGWVYRCVTMTAELGMTLPLGEQTRDADGKWSFDWTSPISEVLGYWNDDIGPMESKYSLFQHFDLSGNALVGKRFATDLTARGKGGKIPAELRVENPAHVAPIPNEMGGIARYQYIGKGGQLDYWEREDICHGRLPNPSDKYWGQSRLISLARTIDGDAKAQEWRNRLLQKGGIPPGILLDTTITNPKQRKDAQKEIDETWQGRVGPFIAPGAGVQWVAMGMPAKDVSFLEGRVFAMREIAIVFGYSPAVFGEDSTYNNSKVGEREKWLSAVLPRARFLVEMLTMGLIPKNERHRRRIWFDTSEVEALQEDETQKVDRFVKLVAAGVAIDIAAKRVGLDLPEVEGGLGKVPLVDNRLVSLRTVVEGLEDPPL